MVGQGGSSPAGSGSRPRENPNIGGTQITPQVDPALEGLGQIPGVLNVTTFTSPQSASNKTLELTNGTLSGAHTHTTSTGVEVWMPFPTMKEFEDYLAQAKEKDICVNDEDCNIPGF